MAKSKRKSKKSNKQKKQAQKRQVKQTQKVIAAPKTSENNRNIRIGIVGAIVLAILIGVILIVTANDKSVKGIQSSAEPTPNPSGQQTIEVKQPNATGTPKSPDYQLQGSSPSEQEARGGLQEPQTSDILQPNAKIDNYENAQIN